MASIAFKKPEQNRCRSTDPPWHIDAVGGRSHHQSGSWSVCGGPSKLRKPTCGHMPASQKPAPGSAGLRHDKIIGVFVLDGPINGDAFTPRECKHCLRHAAEALTEIRHALPRAPSVRQPISLGPGVGRVQHVLMYAGDPAAPGDFRDHRRPVANRGLSDDAPLKRRSDD